MDKKRIVFRQQDHSMIHYNLMEMETEYGILHNITDVNTVIAEGRPTTITITFLVDASTPIIGDWDAKKGHLQSIEIIIGVGT